MGAEIRVRVRTGVVVIMSPRKKINPIESHASPTEFVCSSAGLVQMGSAVGGGAGAPTAGAGFFAG